MLKVLIGYLSAMIDFEHARSNMVDCQVRTCDVTEHELISAMLSVQREEFVPSKLQSLAYIDEDLSLNGIASSERYLMQAASFAKLAQLAAVEKDDVVLVVGSGCGYSSAVLSLMATSVVAIEEDGALVEFSSEVLSRLGYMSVAVLNSELSKGYPKEAPYDVIFFEGSIEFLPSTFLDQLAEGGRLVCVQGAGNSALAKLYSKNDGLISERDTMNCAIKPLSGFKKAKEFAF